MFWENSDIDQLIAKKKYTKAVKLLREHLAEHPDDTFRQQKLADVLFLSGEDREAICILSRLVQDFAKRGFISKAIALLKKIQRVKPDLEGLDEKVADLIRRREEENGVSPHAVQVPADDEDDMETIELSGEHEALPLTNEVTPKESAPPGTLSLDEMQDASQHLVESGSPAVPRIFR